MASKRPAILRRPWAAVCLLALALAGCNAGFGRFPFLDEAGRAVALRESPGRPKDREGVLDAAAGEKESPYYGLGKPVVVGTGLALAVTYASTLSACEISVITEGRKVLTRASLPSAGGTPVRFLLPLKAGDAVHGMRLSTTAASGKLELMAAGLTAMRRGFAVEDGVLRLDASIGTVRAPTLAAPLEDFTVELSEQGRAALRNAAWHLRLVPAAAPGGGGSGILGFRDAEGRRNGEFAVRSEGRPVDFHFTGASLPFLPQAVSFASDTKGWGLIGLAIETLEEGAPLPADPGQILEGDRKAWRRPEYEIYSWDRFPDFLIMDTADYGVMDRLFNRLAFFVEKAGTTGRILDDAALKGKHAYNAHDYRAEDLARFFTAAAAQGAGLNRLEEELRQVLERAGVIVRATSGWAPGKGGILSISREGGRILRELLLTHECFHGVFFSLPGFREAAEMRWEALSPAEERVWRAFLGSKGYNPEDAYLTVNEFQAYLFQQEETQVGAFQATTLSRLGAASPALAGDIAAVKAMKPGSFLSSFRALDSDLGALGGPPGGRVAFVRRLE